VLAIRKLDGFHPFHIQGLWQQKLEERELAAFVALLDAPSLLLLCSLLSLSSLVFRRGGLEFFFLSRPLLERLGEIWFWVGFFLGRGGLLGFCYLGGLVT